MPIKGRIDMLTTGIRTPVGVKIFGEDLGVISRVGEEVERAVKGVRGTRSAFSERASGGYFIDIKPDRPALARFGLTVEDLQAVITTAVGGETVTTTVEGRARYSVSVRYPRNQREDLTEIERVLVPTPQGYQVPIEQVARVTASTGPSMIRNEGGMLAGYVYVDVAGRDLGSYVEEAKRAVAASVKLPVGYHLVWSGQYENMLRVRERLKVVLPVTLLLILVLLYMNTRSAFKSGLVMLAVPFSLVGAVWFMVILGYNISIAAWVGMIALMGLDAETGVFMLLFLDIACADAKKAGRLNTLPELKEALVTGAVKRIRPKLMTVGTSIVGLLPIMWSTGTGADVMKRIAALVAASRPPSSSSFSSTPPYTSSG
jgi:Cu(I)/Ag(I) efflux system membrane protein CusA/SilA